MKKNDNNEKKDTFSDSSSTDSSISSALAFSNPSTRKLSDKEGQYLYSIPGKVEAFLINEMHQQALNVIASYLKESPTPAQIKVAFFKALQGKINKRPISFQINGAINDALDKVFKPVDKTKTGLHASHTEQKKLI